MRETVYPKRGAGAKDPKFPRKWVLVDLDGKVLGRAAVAVATILRGKDKAHFTPAAPVGDYVVAINAQKVRLTGAKLEKKIYRRHTGYYGHVKAEPASHYLARKPAEMFRDAVWGMLPHNKLGRRLILNLKVYAGDKHPHVVQAPQPKTPVGIDSSKKE